ncbi:hypothetical protein C1645_836208 [Glomus cerebriforme]|uniref:Uncharacterized protein n=1 Tax=Glomus cerebriforme TaxID=658196 RepID=A0A397S7D3_9GLOM|nr:hypothetical protein C1645_836208 [Glomus cerebriforme]
MATKKGDDNAQFNLGKCYEYRKGVDKDEKKVLLKKKIEMLNLTLDIIMSNISTSGN